MNAVKNILITCFVLLTAASAAQAKLPKEQIYSLYSQANDSFRQANAAKDPDQQQRLYEKAILNFEKIIDQGDVQNAALYYNLANTYLLTNHLGKAILNYRRALKIDGSDENIKKNLAFARGKRIDKIPVKTEKRVLQTLFFWHYDFSLKTRFLLTCILFGLLSLCITAAVWFGKNNVWTVSAVICAVLMICLLTSVALEYKTKINKQSGVITVAQVIARQGDGENYTSSFKDSLHEGTEFDLLESRPGWLRIKLSDGSEGWIPDNTAELI